MKRITKIILFFSMIFMVSCMDMYNDLADEFDNGDSVSTYYAAVTNGYLYASYDGGITWQELTASGSRDWSSIALSPDGSRVVATVTDGKIYCSTDNGSSWPMLYDLGLGDSPLNTIALSLNGKYMVAGSGSGSMDPGHINVSSNYGVSWSPFTVGSDSAWRSVAISDDGSKIVGVNNGYYIHTSSNNGVSWFSRATNDNWFSISSSADGSKLAAAVGSGGFYTSSNSGVTWGLQAGAGSRNWRSIAMSSDGSKIAAVVENGNIYISKDSGITWVSKESSRNWRSITSSANGKKLAAVVWNGHIYISNNSGDTWSESVGPVIRDWISITSSKL